MEESTKGVRLKKAYEAYADDIYRILVKEFGEEEYVKDAIHEAFLSYYDVMDTVEIQLIEAWLIRVARNIATNTKKRESIILEKKIIISEENAVSAEEVILEKETCEELRDFRKSVLDDLQARNPLWYEVLMMVCVTGMSHKEVAKELGLQMCAVHSRLKRARKWIRENYKEELDDVIKNNKKDAPYEETS